METSNKEEELSKGCWAVLVNGHVRAIYRLGDKLIHRVEIGHQCTFVRTMDKVSPLPSLTAQEGDTTEKRPQQPLYHIFPVITMSGLYRKYHGHRTHNQNKGHERHKYQRQMNPMDERKSVENPLRNRPIFIGTCKVRRGSRISRITEAYSSVSDQESRKSKNI